MIDLSFLKDIPLFYISPDIRRALGLELILPNYHMICSFYEPLVELVRKKGGQVFCLEEKIGKEAFSIKNSGQLLENNYVKEFINERSGNRQPHILYFKPSLKLDLICQNNNYKKLVNSYDLNEKFENKINLFEITKIHLPQYHIDGEIGIFKNLNFKDLKTKYNLPFVLQFGHGWAGNTTFIITDESEFARLKKKYNQTKIKITQYVRGKTVLNNCCIYKDKILIGPPAIQLSGFKELLPNDSITCGRQWPLPNLTQEQKEKILEASQKIGAYMKQNKYKGFFGLDFIIEENTNKIFVSECNARFTASTPFYTSLELKEDEIPLIAYHIAAFLGIRLPHKIMTKCTGTQIIVRNNQAAKVKINNNLLSGTYIYKGNNIQFINDNYEVNKLKPKEFIILPQRPDKLVDTNEEIARIELIEEVVTGSQLKNNIKNIIDILRKKLLVK